MGNRHGRSNGNGFKEIFRHEFRHPDAPVRGWIARQISRMHSDTTDYAHEIRHGRTFKVRPGWLRIFAELDIGFHHIIGVINVIPVFARNIWAMEKWPVGVFKPSRPVDNCEMPTNCPLL